ncbi:aromatic ring-hydroxylating dioxygenase subunit alpha [uncultured Methylobacterium sp.]|uniref:aromatic ring-hydroxylating oxygenase subunit alpha n=1 Tax=uncultured Methylobacterium sp. TaxID=157278 RepID=UPI002596479D|nr:aromatic ring-hydroxylating dioxygenase subunit alpha [uncultured Methylobacterium sp.]
MDHIDRLIDLHVPGMGLDRAFYTDASIFERDMECIFRRHWHCAGHASMIDAPGDFFTFNYAQETVVVARDKDGSIHAFLNVCRHRGAEVCTDTSGNTEFFVCPYHAWTYGLDGSLKAARHMPRDFDTRSHGLKTLHVRVVEGLIFISFAPVPLDFAVVEESLRTTIGRYGWGSAKIAHRETYPVHANWKLAVENYVECYHCGPAHPEYSKTHALEQPQHRIEKLNAKMEQRTRNLGIEIHTGDNWQNSLQGQEAIHSFRYALYDGVASGSEDGSAVAPTMGDFTDYDGGVTSIHLGGSTFLVCYPDHGMIYRFVPRTHLTSEMELIWLVRKDAQEGKDYDLHKLTWLWKVTTEEDKKIIEHTSRGVCSHYFQPGPIAPMEYNELRYINWYLDEIRARSSMAA